MNDKINILAVVVGPKPGLGPPGARYRNMGPGGPPGTGIWVQGAAPGLPRGIAVVVISSNTTPLRGSTSSSSTAVAIQYLSDLEVVVVALTSCY